MPIDLHNDPFPYSTYREYVSALSTTDHAFQNLASFLASTPDSEYGPHYHRETQVPRDGLVTIIDRIQGRIMSQQFPIGPDASNINAGKSIDAINVRPDTTETRVVLLSYHRDPFTGEYTGVNTDVVDAIGIAFRVHPEVLMWHFGSEFGLDKRFFRFAKPPIPSALSTQTYFHLQNEHSLFSCCLYSSKSSSSADTVIFARDYEFPNWSLLVSRVVFLDSPMPASKLMQLPDSRWINDLYLRAIERLAFGNKTADFANPVEYVIPYAQMILINATFVMDTWETKVMHPQGKTSANLEVHYDKQVGKLNEIRLNLDALRSFTFDTSSKKWRDMLKDYERVFHSTEQQINVVLAQKMTYRAAMASLDESKIGIEHSKRSIEQNARVKRVTQLAFVFIPLSFSTSIFGMNLEILGTGTAKTWMVFVAVAFSYAAISLIWIVIDFSNVKAALIESMSGPHWSLSSWESRYGKQDSAKVGPLD